ncbi:hypothetical protein CHUAL_012628 [Chamberlinius hualienensis]
MANFKETTNYWKPSTRGYWEYSRFKQPDLNSSLFYWDGFYHWTNKNTQNVNNDGNAIKSLVIYRVTSSIKFYAAYWLHAADNESSNCIDFYFKPTVVNKIHNISKPLKTICQSAEKWRIAEFKCGDDCCGINSTCDGKLHIVSRLSAENGTALIAISCVTSRNTGGLKCHLPKEPTTTTLSTSAKTIPFVNPINSDFSPSGSRSMYKFRWSGWHKSKSINSKSISNIPSFFTYWICFNAMCLWNKSA